MVKQMNQEKEQQELNETKSQIPGFELVFEGNYLMKYRSNFTIGVIYPETLARVAELGELNYIEKSGNYLWIIIKKTKLSAQAQKEREKVMKLLHMMEHANDDVKEEESQ